MLVQMPDGIPKPKDVIVKQPVPDEKDYIGRIKRHIKLLENEEMVIKKHTLDVHNLVSKTVSKAFIEGNYQEQKKIIRKRILGISKSLVNNSLKLGKQWLK